MTYCDGKSYFAGLNEIDRFRKGEYNNIFKNYLIRLQYMKNLQNFFIPCCGMAAGEVIYNVKTLKIPKSLVSILRYSVKVTYNLYNLTHPKNYEIRYMNNGDIEVWKVGE